MLACDSNISYATKHAIAKTSKYLFTTGISVPDRSMFKFHFEELTYYSIYWYTHFRAIKIIPCSCALCAHM